MKPVEKLWIITGLIFFIGSIIGPYFITDDMVLRWGLRGLILSVFAIPFGVWGVVITWGTTDEDRMKISEHITGQALGGETKGVTSK